MGRVPPPRQDQPHRRGQRQPSHAQDPGEPRGAARYVELLIDAKACTYDELRKIISRDYEVFSGHALEALFRQVFLERHAYTRMGGWWDRKGENEIDLVCENEFSNELHVYEVKRDARRFCHDKLAVKAEALLTKNPERRNWKLTLGSLSLSDL